MYKTRILITILLILAAFTVSESAVLFDRVVAVVNQEVITWSELYKNMESDASPQLKEMKEEERIKVFRSNEAMFLDNLINYKLQIQEARNLGLGVSDEEVKDAVENIKKKYTMSENDFRESLNKEGFTFDEYRKKIQEQILISKIVNQQIRNKILVSDTDVSRFLDENKEYSVNTEGYRLSQIFFKKPKNSEDKKAVEDRAESVIMKIKEGGSFQELAKQFSEEPLGSSGGNLGLIKRDHLVKEFTEVLSNMKQGDVSRPFWADRGLHIIRLDEKIGARDKDEIRAEARKEVLNRIFLDKYNAWLKSLREKSFIEIKL